jgi:hypothetical protein
MRAKNPKPKLFFLDPKAKIIFIFTTQKFRPSLNTQKGRGRPIER